MKLQWVPLRGIFDVASSHLVFGGGEIEVPSEQGLRNGAEVGAAMTSQRFNGGRITADVEFSAIDEFSAAQIVLYRDPATEFIVTAGFGALSGVGLAVGMYSVRYNDGQRWFDHKIGGDFRNFSARRKYRLSVDVWGSRVAVSVDGVDVITADLPWTLPESQVGVWLRSKSQVTISDFQVQTQRAKAFVIMQFSSPYNEMYMEVIKSVCEEQNVEVIRADEEYGPGVIISDIARQIVESKVIIADISPANPNVYYEVGYAHALNKPTILLAESPTKLPFDVAPHRVLFYENTIAGKSRLEQGLRRHLHTVLNEVQAVG